MSGVEVAFRYAGRSGLRVDRDAARLGLASSERRTFVEGTAARGDVVAAGLLLVARVALTSFTTPAEPPAAASDAADPLVTTGDGHVRFESLSPCGGVAARLDLLPSGLDGSPYAPGTTSIDLDARVRELLSTLVGRDPLHLTIGAAGLPGAHDARPRERRTVLDEDWLRALVGVQVHASRVAWRAELGVRHARTLLRSLVATSATAHLVAGRGGVLRAAVTPAADGISVPGADRLHVLEPLLRLADALRVGVDHATGTTWWELDLPHARVSVALASGPGFAPASGPGSGLASGPGFAPASGRPAFALESGPGSAVGAPHAHATAASSALQRATTGRAAFDVTEGRWYDRILPFGHTLLTPTSYPPAPEFAEDV